MGPYNRDAYSSAKYSRNIGELYKIVVKTQTYGLLLLIYAYDQGAFYTKSSQRVSLSQIDTNTHIYVHESILYFGIPGFVIPYDPYQNSWKYTDAELVFLNNPYTTKQGCILTQVWDKLCLFKCESHELAHRYDVLDKPVAVMIDGIPVLWKVIRLWGMNFQYSLSLGLKNIRCL